jgi:pimeloyl-ACP methyl ester carboxylesterase
MHMTPEANARTRAFARVIGPFLIIVPSIIVVRAPDMETVASAFFGNEALVWITGGLLLLTGLLIIANHQYWSSVAVVMISLFGWFLAASWFGSVDHTTMVCTPAIEAHLSVIGNPQAMEAAQEWYRARGVRHAPVEPTRVPTLFIWGDQDDTVGRAAAEGTAEFIAAPYKYAELPGVGHYAADQVPEQVNVLLLEHLKHNPF